MIINNQKEQTNLKTSVTYKGNGTQKQFDFPFDYLRKAFVKVSVNDAIVDGYIIDNRSVIFNNAPASNDVIVIYRETPTDRLVAWRDASIIKATDMTVQQVQELHILEETRTDVGGLMGDCKDVLEDSKNTLEEAHKASNVATSKAEEAATSLNEFKEMYNGETLTPIKDLVGNLGSQLKRWGTIFVNKVFASNLPIVYKNIEEMKKDVLLIEGMTTQTLGYYTANDGGGGSYIIRAKTVGDVEDGGSIHFLQKDLVAELIVENGTVNVKQFGAKGDATTDDSNAIQQAVNSKYSSVYIPKGTYLISKTISVPTTLKTMSGEHSSTTIIKVDDSGFEFADTNNYFTLQHLRITGNDKENTFGIKARFYSFYAVDVVIRDFTNGYGWYLAGNNEQGEVWSGFNIFTKCSAINCYYGLYVNSTPFNLNYFNNLFVSGCQIGFTLKGLAENLAFNSCSFEQNDIVFQTLAIINGTCYNCYFEYNRIISTFGNSGYYGTDFLFYKCWFLCSDVKEIGWVCTIPMRSSNEGEQAVITYEKCSFVKYKSSTPKMFTFTVGTGSKNYLGVSIKECSFENFTPVYLNLFDLTSNPNYATYYDAVDINTDLPFYKQDGLVWYSVGGGINYNSTKTRKFRVYGKYIPTEATNQYLNIIVPANVTTYDASTLFAIVRYTDGTIGILTGSAKTKLIQLSNLDTTKTVSYILFDCEYGSLSMAS